MRLKFLFSLFISIFGISQTAWSEIDSVANPPINSDTKIHRSGLTVGTEISQLQLPTASFLGLGFSFAYQYAVNSNWAVRPQIGQVLNTSGGTYLYTSFAGFVTYALTGSQLWGSSDVTFGGKPVSSITYPRLSTFSVGVGVEQLLLNGTQAVYAAPGYSALATYTTPVLGTWISFSGRLGQYQSNQQQITGILFNVAFPFAL
jgi:hypothetical protein